MTEERKIDDEQKVYDDLVVCANKIIQSNEINAIKEFDEGQKIFTTCQSIKTLYTYMLCIINLAQKSLTNCKQFIITLPEMLESLVESKHKCQVKEIMDKAYLFLLLWGLSLGLNYLVNIRVDNLIKSGLILNKTMNDYNDKIEKYKQNSVKLSEEDIALIISETFLDNALIQLSYVQILNANQELKKSFGNQKDKRVYV